MSASETAEASQWISEATRAALDRLTAQQERAVIRIVEARVLEGRGVNALLNGPNPICAFSTYYRRKPPGWSHQPAFREAVRLAEADLRRWFADHALEGALDELRRASGEAARELRRQVTGDATALAALTAALEADDPAERKAAAEQLGQAAHAAAAEPLATRLFREKVPEVRVILLWALGQIAAASNAGAFRAASAVLDRVGTETAAKGATHLTMDWRTVVEQARMEDQAEGAAQVEMDWIAEQESDDGGDSDAPATGAA